MCSFNWRIGFHLEVVASVHLHMPGGGVDAIEVVRDVVEGGRWTGSLPGYILIAEHLVVNIVHLCTPTSSSARITT
jgi:hypothetical protein